MKQEYKTGLWNKNSQKGVTYGNGKIKVGEKLYKVTLFTNNTKNNDKSPDYNLILTELDEIPSGEEKSQKTDLNDVFEKFGDTVQAVMDDDSLELPF